MITKRVQQVKPTIAIATVPVEFYKIQMEIMFVMPMIFALMEMIILMTI